MVIHPHLSTISYLQRETSSSYLQMWITTLLCILLKRFHRKCRGATYMGPGIGKMVNKWLLSLLSQDLVNGHKQNNSELLHTMTWRSVSSQFIFLMRNKQPALVTAPETCSRHVVEAHSSKLWTSHCYESGGTKRREGFGYCSSESLLGCSHMT